MVVPQDNAANPLLRWVLWLLGATLISLAIGFAVGLARPRRTTLPAREMRPAL